ncbi:MAG: bis-aminopropyl spermidine synthase family protein [Armatimonadetes bacterium]|nr:bis-aminopropyl spermidine synthase family protein [Armatimonadota bacterium]
MFGEELRKHVKPDPAWVDLVAQVTQHPDRPRPVRSVDQIFMLPGSQLTQALLVSDYLKYRDVVMVGDGDCMGLVMAHLANKGLFRSPAKIRIFDFDERLLAFIAQAVRDLGIPPDLISCHRYNVRDPIPERYAQAHEVFYTNPPYGSADCGECGKLFLARCMEFCKPAPSWGVALLPFAHKEDWSRDAMGSIQTFLCGRGYVVSEMVREIHQYHLEDRPSLRSCNLVVDRIRNIAAPYEGARIEDEQLSHFYGRTPMRMPEYISINAEFVYSDGTREVVGDEPKWRTARPALP